MLNRVKKSRGRPKGRTSKPRVKKAVAVAPVDVEKLVEVNDLTKDKDTQIRRLKDEVKSLQGTIHYLKGSKHGTTTKTEANDHILKESTQDTGEGGTSEHSGGAESPGGLFDSIF